MANDRVAVVIDVVCMEGDEYRYYLHEVGNEVFIVPCVRLKGSGEFIEYPRNGWVKVDSSRVAEIEKDPQSVLIRQHHVSAFDLVERNEVTMPVGKPAHS